MTAPVPLVERLAEVAPKAWEVYAAYALAHSDDPDGWDGIEAMRLALQSALLPEWEQALAEARGEALREAADRWTQGAWSDVMLPKPTPPAVPVIAYSNRVGDWLRERAALGSGVSGDDRG